MNNGFYKGNSPIDTHDAASNRAKGFARKQSAPTRAKYLRVAVNVSTLDFDTSTLGLSEFHMLNMAKVVDIHGAVHDCDIRTPHLTPLAGTVSTLTKIRVPTGGFLEFRLPEAVNIDRVLLWVGERWVLFCEVFVSLDGALWEWFSHFTPADVSARVGTTPMTAMISMTRGSRPAASVAAPPAKYWKIRGVAEGSCGVSLTVNGVSAVEDPDVKISTVHSLDDFGVFWDLRNINPRDSKAYHAWLRKRYANYLGMLPVSEYPDALVLSYTTIAALDWVDTAAGSEVLFEYQDAVLPTELIFAYRWLSPVYEVPTEAVHLRPAMFYSHNGYDWELYLDEATATSTETSDHTRGYNLYTFPV